MSAVNVEQIAADALREHLLLAMPAKVAEVNLTRGAVLTAPWAGPFVVPAGSTLGIGVVAGNATFKNVPLTTGAVQTSAQVAADINAVTGLVGTAAVDDQGRWYVTSPTPPSAAADSKVELRGGTATDLNATFGFSKGGAKVINSALLAPTYECAFDGWPVTPVFAPRSAVGAYVAFVVGDRKAKPREGGPRIDQHIVAMDLTILRLDVAEQHRRREAIQSAMRCVRVCLLSDNGRTLDGRALVVLEVDGHVSAKPFSFTKDLNPLYDGAVLNLSVKIFARPPT